MMQPIPAAAEGSGSVPIGIGGRPRGLSGGGGRGWFGGWGVGEEKMGLAGHDSAMDHCHLQSGAISPADSDHGGDAYR